MVLRIGGDVLIIQFSAKEVYDDAIQVGVWRMRVQRCLAVTQSVTFSICFVSWNCCFQNYAILSLSRAIVVSILSAR